MDVCLVNVAKEQFNHSSIWITANAGSGKTTFLTRRVVALLLMGVEPERICCITYTKAAASEMRHRVLALLRSLLLAEPQHCRELVEGLLGRTADEAEIARARRLFGTVLDSPSGGLQLTTIHGFCQTVLRRFPLEAGIAPHFTVLEEEAAASLLARAKHRLLEGYAAGDAWLDAAFGLIGIRTSESRFEDYISAIIQKRGAWERIWNRQTEESLRGHVWRAHGLTQGVTDAELQQALLQCILPEWAAVIRAHLPELEGHKNKGEREIARVLAAWLAADEPARAPMLDAFCGLFLTATGAPRKQVLAKSFDGSPLAEVMGRLALAVLHGVEQRAALACAEESFAVAVIARALLVQYRMAKEMTHALDYDDLIGKVIGLFSNPSMLGWVMSKLDHRIDHLLVDEAQDTSGEQWMMAKLLVEELIAANDGLGSGNVPRSLLVVGDEKQSIYSFQGAAPELFSAKKTEFHQMLDASLSPLREEMLTTSYRSAEAVLAVVDDIAAQPPIARALNAEGVIHPHRLKRSDAAGVVMLYTPLAAPEKIPQPPLEIPADYQLAQTAPRQLAEQVADTVAQWIAQGRLLASEGRPVTAGDILILVRTRSTMVLSLIRAFERRGVPVAGLDRLTLAEHLAVRDMLALVRWVINPADDLALAHVLRSPLVGMSDDALRELCVGRAGMLLKCLRDAGDAAPLEAWLELRHLPPYEFLTAVLETGGARTRFAERFGAEVHEVLDELKNQSAALPQGMPPTLAYFHDWLAGSTRQVKREQEEAGAGLVRIMTVHGAKGLEAPVVLLVDTVGMPSTQHETMYFTPSQHGQLLPVLSISAEAKQAPLLCAAKEQKKAALLAEYYRLLYVALTRARDELHIWGIASKKGEVPEGCWYALVGQALRRLGAQEQEGALTLADLRPPVVPREIMASVAPHAVLPAWARMPAPPALPQARVMTPSNLVPETSVSAYVQSAGEAANVRGVKIHRVLELLPAQADAATVARLVALVAGGWDAAEQARVAADILALHNAHAWIWQSPSHAEVTLSGTVDIHGRAVPMYGQIDRLVETPEAVVILDYKTGRHVPRSAEEIPETYRVQLKAYRAMVAQLYPNTPVRCAILWTSDLSFMWCDDVVTATGWPNQFVIQNPPLVA